MSITSVDSELQAIIDAAPAPVFEGICDEQILAARRNRVRPAQDIPLRVQTTDVLVGVGGNESIRVRVYWPPNDGPYRALLNLHGGGWVAGQLEMNDPLCHHVAAHAQCLVVSADYRLAPEHPFPCGLEDCMAVFRWIVENGRQLNIDIGRIAVGGVSAGGNLAGALCMVAREMRHVRIARQILMCPVCDGELKSPSYRTYATMKLLGSRQMEWYWRQYMGSDISRWTNPLASLVHAQDLSDLPPAFILTAEFDVLRDEAETYARQLHLAGVPTRLQRYAGGIHAFMDTAPHSKIARSAWADILAEIVTL